MNHVEIRQAHIHVSNDMCRIQEGFVYIVIDMHLCEGQVTLFPLGS